MSSQIEILYPEIQTLEPPNDSSVVDSVFSGYIQPADSIFDLSDNTVTLAQQKFITESIEEPILFREISNNKDQQGWQIGALFFCMILLTFLRLTQKNYFKNIITGISSKAIFNQMLRDGNFMSAFAVIPSFLIFIVTMSLLIFQLILLEQPVLSNGFSSEVSKFTMVLSIVAGFFFIKAILIRIIGYIFKMRSLSTLYLANKVLFNTMTGIVFLPLLVLSTTMMNNTIFYITLFTGFLIFIFSILRGILIILSIRKYSLYQIFIYLCTLEILPVLIIVKLLIKDGQF
nr:DUF4271 domain-containing protein [Bacteroidota bacterium]